jgi:hypothetical protein
LVCYFKFSGYLAYKTAFPSVSILSENNLLDCKSDILSETYADCLSDYPSKRSGEDCGVNACGKDTIKTKVSHKMGFYSWLIPKVILK